MNEKLINEICNYFDGSFENMNIITKSGLIHKIRHKGFNEIDLFIFFYNDKKKYEREKATFNHNTQQERFIVLDDYKKDFNFFKFRVSMNKLLRKSYYIGHPSVFNY